MWQLPGVWLGRVILLTLALQCPGTAAQANDASPSPEPGNVQDTAPSQVLLEITDPTSGETVELNRKDLQALPAATLTTSTVVTDGTHEFRGFLMRDLLEQMNIPGSQVTAIALNDYAVNIPVKDFYRFDVIVAYAMDGKRLTRSGKGPLWIVYPRDAHRALQDIRYDYRWVWQLYRLEVQ
ncbi:molybdopterin-dependent oxidoreductase [Halomonas piscis]|uniref:molybdopterin-dependent oxidoreductase n=1 Tax=Halomonas piscis TaxID=3031727 RepID=UPI0028A130C9|nr:molybdopterin-dependent oxidoreductase [Halomonas piscis]